ncbi:MAG: M15 family metallopeptidase [Paludibacter sp.]|nr:M15 family metallopeptidase [Paludibacter sp.]
MIISEHKYFVSIFISTTLIFVVLSYGCSKTHNNSSVADNDTTLMTEPADIIPEPSIIIDCNYSFAGAIAGTQAPDSVTNQLVLLNVQYFSTDGKVHQGQILCSQEIEKGIVEIFKFMFEQKFPVAKAIPIVKYGWDDHRSMADNNTYSFCYRDVSYSKHASGMAIDINPFFNPVRYKNDSIVYRSEPIGAKYDPDIPGTFTEKSFVVQKFRDLGFRWGHTFRTKFDDHHFEK